MRSRAFFFQIISVVVPAAPVSFNEISHPLQRQTAAAFSSDEIYLTGYTVGKSWRFYRMVFLPTESVTWYAEIQLWSKFILSSGVVHDYHIFLITSGFFPVVVGSDIFWLWRQLFYFVGNDEEIQLKRQRIHWEEFSFRGKRTLLGRSLRPYDVIHL